MNQASSKAKKKVLFIITKSNFGGAQRYVYDLATNLSKDAYEPVVLCGAEDSGKAGVLLHMLANAGIRTIYIPELNRDIAAGRDVASFRAMLRTIRAEKPHIVHLNSSKAGGLGALAARIAGVPRIVFTAHGWAFREKRNPLARAAIFFFSWLTIMLSHITICVSKYDMRSVARLPFTAKKLRVMYNGVPDITFVPRDAAREKLFDAQTRAVHASDLWVLTNAELHANKNIGTALETVARYNMDAEHPIFYTIIGDGEMRPAIERRIKELHLEDAVRLLGFIPDARIYVPAFDIFLLPSKKEGLPFVLLEAGAAEVPVVASAVGGIPEIISDPSVGILCAPEDADAFVRGLRKLSDQGARLRYASALKKRVDSAFSLDRAIRETVAVYER